jgi:hypothetical protein
MRATTNLRWGVGETSSSPLAAADNWTRASMVFYASPVNRITLLEQRDAGTTRPEGIFYLRGLALTRYD